MDNDLQPMIWKYENGEWAQVLDPISESEEYDTALRDAGFLLLDSWGAGVPDVDIYQSADSDRWRVDYSPAAGVIDYQSIEVTRFPDLLNLLSTLGVITTASMLSYVADRLDSLIQAAGAETDRQRRARRRKPG